MQPKTFNTYNKIFASIFLYLLIFVSFSSPLRLVILWAETTEIPVVPVIPFVLIQSQDTYLYKLTDTDEFIAISTIPQSYYCTLVSEDDETYYEVTYYDLDGFIKKSDAVIVDYEPVTKYALGTLTINIDSSSVNLRSDPDHTADNVVASGSNSETLSYYGSCSGSSPIATYSDMWYYCKTTNQYGESVNCYVYSAYCTAIPIEENDLQIVMYTPEEESSTDISIPEMSSTMTAIVVVCLCIPTVIVMILLTRKDAPSQKTPRYHHYD